MSKASALMGARSDGATMVEEMGLRGMITVKGDLSDTDLKNAVTGTSGLDFPAQRQISTVEERALAWMAPDELLLLCPHDEADQMVATISGHLAGQFATVINVSDARAMFRVSGPDAREVLAKLAPVDLHPDSFGPGEMRRTRLAQVAAAIWQSDDDEFLVVCFRSVAQYVFDILSLSAQDGSDVGYF